MCSISVPDKRRGVVTVEFSIVIATLVMLVHWSFEFARAAAFRNIADTFACEPARELIVPGARVAVGQTFGEQLLRGAVVSAWIVDISPRTITEDTPAVTVRVTLPYQRNS